MNQQPIIAVVGAGPAGLFAAHDIINHGMHVVLFNRDIKPGGLAEYGIFFDKYKMKAGLRKQFQHMLNNPSITYLGNYSVGRYGIITLKQLDQLNFNALLITTGAQGTKRLGIEGEELRGVYHAKDLVFHYNKLPPYAAEQYSMGRRVAIVGAGNVMVDIANWLIRYLQVDEVIAIVRRGSNAVKFDKKEFKIIFNNLDTAAFEKEIQRIHPALQKVGIDVEKARTFILSAESGSAPRISNTTFRFEFLASLTQILGNEEGEIAAVELEDNDLALTADGKIKAVGKGTFRTLTVDSVVYAIGDKVDDELGLPLSWDSYSCHPNPLFPIGHQSYEAFNPVTNKPLDNIFLAGWAREASSGLVGYAKKDGINGAKAIQQFIASRKQTHSDLVQILAALRQINPYMVTKHELARLEQFEQEQARLNNLPEFKLTTNEAMLQIMGING